MYSAPSEAIAAEIYRFLGPLDLTSKVRLATNGTPSSNQSLIAIKKFNAFISAFHISLSGDGHDKVLQLCQSQLKRISALLVSSYCLEEYDLHSNNWGITDINGRSCIVKIDHDFSFFSLDLHVYPKPTLSNLKQRPQCIYLNQETVRTSLHDIEHLPITLDFIPPNSFQNSFPSIAMKLSNNAKFIQWKFYYFTKFLLTPQSQIDSIISDFISDQSDLEIQDLAQNIKKIIL